MAVYSYIKAFRDLLLNLILLHLFFNIVAVLMSELIGNVFI